MYSNGNTNANTYTNANTDTNESRNSNGSGNIYHNESGNSNGSGKLFNSGRETLNNSDNVHSKPNVKIVTNSNSNQPEENLNKIPEDCVLTLNGFVIFEFSYFSRYGLSNGW